MAQTVKHLPTIQETQVQSLGWEDLLEKEMATHSSILAWKIPWMEEPGRLQSMGLQKLKHDWATLTEQLNFHFPVQNKKWKKEVLEKTLESPLDSKEIKPVNPKGNQPWIFTGRTDAEAEAPILWLPDEKCQLTDAGKDWRWEESGATKNEMVGWHHWLNGH